ncbi:MAG: translocation/assembly module TamB domain-containing protein [Nitrospirota bacterium]
MRKRTKRILYIVAITVVIGILIFVSQGPYISNALKRVILPSLEAASGKRVIAQKIYINVFPLFIGVKGLKVFDEDGNRIAFAKRIKGYVEPSGILHGQIYLQRLVVKEPDISGDKEHINEIIESVKAYLKKEKIGKFKVKVNVVEIAKGNIFLRSGLNDSLDIKGFAGEVILKKEPMLKASIEKFNIKKEGLPEFTGDIKTSLILKEDKIEIKSLEIGSYGSRIKGEGFYSGGRSYFKTEIELFIDSVKRILGLRHKGEGKILAEGEIKLEGIQHPAFKVQQVKNIFVDLKLKGNFYLETLMELLKVRTKEKISGLVDFQGEIRGPLTDISGKANARLQNGSLFNVDIDSLICNISYKDGIMKFENGSASLYKGTAQAEALLALPQIRFFDLNVRFHSIDSRAALKLIGWEPDISAGKVDGGLTTSGSKFNPDGWFVYKKLSVDEASSDDVLKRIKDIKGRYSLRDEILSLTDLQLNTSLSDFKLNGTVDIPKKLLNLKGVLTTNEVSDLALPYYEKIKGRGNFSGEIAGHFDSPQISGNISISNSSVEGYEIDNITSAFLYKKNILDIHELVFRSSSEEHIVKGKIFFPEAKKIFDFFKPIYSLKASLRNAEFGKTIQIFYKDFVAEGRLYADVNIGGRDKDFDISGDASLKDASVYKVPFDSATLFFSYIDNVLSLKEVKIMKGQSVVRGEGRLLPNKEFSYIVSSERFLIKNVFEGLPKDGFLSFYSQGHGTFENPMIIFKAGFDGGTFNGKSLGKGDIDIAIEDKKIKVFAALFNKKITLKGNGYLDERLPWSAEIDIQPGRYDLFIVSIMKDAPEDAHLNLAGRIEMKGDKKHITALANLKHMAISFFGETFTNDSDIEFSIDDRKILFTDFTIRSGAASFGVKGGIEIGKEYNLHLKGTSYLSPLKGLSKKIGYLKGNADFILSVTGKWERPQINGKMNISDASFGLKGYPAYISSINGHVYMDGDKIVIERLSGKIGGGNVSITGSLYLKALRLKRFYIEADLDNITTMISKDFSINFNGNLLYRGTLDSQNITGDIKIKRAKYKEMIEWRTWLLKGGKPEKPQGEISVFEEAELNIRISGSNNIFVDNNIARATLKIDLILKGTISNPILFGRVESKEGNIYFRNNEFRIISASADFADPHRIRPFINLTAVTIVKGYNIRLNLEGYIDHFNLSLSSDPSLEDVDILALLTVGNVGKELKGLEGGIGAGEATAFLMGETQDVIQERFRNLTGIDRIEIEPYVSETTNTIGPRITVAKRLVGDRLFVTYTTMPASTEEDIIKLEYILTRKVSLVGTRDERGIVGGDIKFRFEFR